MSGQRLPGGFDFDRRLLQREQALAEVLKALVRIWDDPARLEKFCADLSKLANKVQ